jgi:hypothetical protein
MFAAAAAAAVDAAAAAAVAWCNLLQYLRDQSAAPVRTNQRSMTSERRDEAYQIALHSLRSLSKQN